MFEKIKDSFYQSLSKSIKSRKEALKLKRRDILDEETRVSKIVNNTHNEHHPYLIGKGEYHYLIYLFICEDHDSFINRDILNATEETLIKGCHNNYDKMLWEHIDWDKMFQEVITESSKCDSSENLGKLFENTLVDYIPYALIRYDELSSEYSKKYFFTDNREKTRQKAIEWVHLRNGSELFKKAFYKRFSGKTLKEFDKGFFEFVSNYFRARKPNKYSLGSLAYNIFKNVSEYEKLWQSFDDIKYGDISDENSDLIKLLEEYRNYSYKHIKPLKNFNRNSTLSI